MNGIWNEYQEMKESFHLQLLMTRTVSTTDSHFVLSHDTK